MDQNVDFSGSDQIQTPQYPEIYPPSKEISDEVFQDKVCSTRGFNELFQKLLEDLHIINKELKCNRPTFSDYNKDHSVQNKEYSENPSNEIAASSSNQEKEGPPQDFDIRQLIREECDVEEVKNVVEQPTERGSRIVKSLQNFRVIHKNSISLKNMSQISPVHAIAPILSTKQPEYSSSTGYEHLSTTPETELDEVTDKLAHINLEITESDFDFEKEIRLIENLVYDNSSPQPSEELKAEIANTIVESIPSSLIPVQDNDSQREEIDIVTNTNELLPPGESDFDNPSVPQPPPEPPDAEFDFELDSGEEISVVMNAIRDEFDVSNDENDDYFSFMFVIRMFLPFLICSKMFLSFLSAKSEDTIFDPGISV
nr:hypothetical protein [Tanacetum cinerariifolium]